MPVAGKSQGAIVDSIVLMFAAVFPAARVVMGGVAV